MIGKRHTHAPKDTDRVTRFCIVYCFVSSSDAVHWTALWGTKFIKISLTLNVLSSKPVFYPRPSGVEGNFSSSIPLHLFSFMCRVLGFCLVFSNYSFMWSVWFVSGAGSASFAADVDTLGSTRTKSHWLRMRYSPFSSLVATLHARKSLKIILTHLPLDFAHVGVRRLNAFLFYLRLHQIFDEVSKNNK